MRKVTPGMLVILMMLGTAAGIHGSTGRPARESTLDEFSPLFADRLEIGARRLDQPAGREPAVLTASERVMIIASGTPFSYCLGSACLGSTCLGSACIGSTCLGSACSGSTCAGSVCGG